MQTLAPAFNSSDVFGKSLFRTFLLLFVHCKVDRIAIYQIRSDAMPSKVSPFVTRSGLQSGLISTVKQWPPLFPPANRSTTNFYSIRLIAKYTINHFQIMKWISAFILTSHSYLTGDKSRIIFCYVNNAFAGSQSNDSVSFGTYDRHLSNCLTSICVFCSVINGREQPNSSVILF